MKNMIKPYWMIVLFALALPLAIALPVWALKLGARPDPQVQVLLKAPSVIETFRKAADSAARPAQSEACPLIAHAKVFAVIIDPPKPVGRSDCPTVRPSDSPGAPVMSRPLFEVKATSEYLTRPQESRALISEPGSGTLGLGDVLDQWVRPTGPTCPTTAATRRTNSLYCRHRGVDWWKRP